MQKSQDDGGLAGHSELPFRLVMDWTGHYSDWHFEVRLAEEKWVKAGHGRIEARTVEEAKSKVQAAFDVAYLNLNLTRFARGTGSFEWGSKRATQESCESCCLSVSRRFRNWLAS